jgi:hypothetical protein
VSKAVAAFFSPARRRGAGQQVRDAVEVPVERGDDVEQPSGVGGHLIEPEVAGEDVGELEEAEELPEPGEELRGVDVAGGAVCHIRDGPESPRDAVDRLAGV